MGYVDPSPIQLRSFPVVLSKRDLIASAQTGTGKTGAFALPILTRLGNGEPITQVAIDLGYGNPSAFTAAFRRVLGMAPSRYLAGPGA